MSDINTFRLYYDKFLAACDSLEDCGSWPLEDLGEMDAWLANDMSCLIIRLIFADGVIRQEEVDFLNSALGFNYTVEELADVYATCGDKINHFLEEELPEDIVMLDKFDPILAGYFRQMLGILAQLVITSDNEVVQKEKDTAEKLLSMIQFEL